MEFFRFAIQHFCPPTPQFWGTFGQDFSFKVPHLWGIWGLLGFVTAARDFIELTLIKPTTKKAGSIHLPPAFLVQSWILVGAWQCRAALFLSISSGQSRVSGQTEQVVALSANHSLLTQFAHQSRHRDPRRPDRAANLSMSQGKG